MNLTNTNERGDMKYKYWINEDGKEHGTTKKLFTYWIKEFCTHVTTNEGRTIKLLDERNHYIKPFPLIDDIYCGYNAFGVKICSRID